MQEAKLSVLERLKADLRVAMKARQTHRVAALRTMISALDNATAVEVDKRFVPMEGVTPDVPRRELSEQDQLDILRAEAENRRAAIEQYERLGKMEEAAGLRDGLAAFVPYLDAAR